jgi:hypothetical protein
MLSNAEYFARRSEQERLAAEGARDPDIAAVHAQMADLYANAARVADAPPPTPIRLFGDPSGA